MGKLSICAVVACLLTASAAAADVQVLLNNGRVSIVAKDATVRQILSEWARVGQTKIINVDRIPGGPLTLELRNVPEGQALDVLLKSVSGYMAAPRQAAVANLSVFDRIIVMPTAVTARPAASAQSAPAFQQPQFQQAVATPSDDDKDDPPANVQVPNQPRGPVFNSFPPPQVGGPNGPVGVPGVMPNSGAVGQTGVSQPAPFGSTPTAPVNGGVSVPGMVAPSPQQPNPLSPSVQPPPPQTRPGGRGGQ
jgi:hypothetical protein